MSNRTRELLNKAKSLIEETEWIQGHLRRYDADERICGYCIMGALQEACHRLNTFDSFRSAYVHIMDKIGTESRLGIIAYNDDPQRTKAQVLALFD